MIGTITLLKLNNFNVIVFGAKVGIEDLTFNFPHSERQIWVDNTPTHIRIEKLDIACYTLSEDLQVGFFTLGTTNNFQTVKLIVTLDEPVATSIKSLLQEYKDIFAWNYTNIKGTLPCIVQHCIEFDTTIPPRLNHSKRRHPSDLTFLKIAFLYV